MSRNQLQEHQGKTHHGPASEVIPPDKIECGYLLDDFECCSTLDTDGLHGVGCLARIPRGKRAS